MTNLQLEAEVILERQRAVIRRLRPDLDLTGKSADYIAACFDIATADALAPAAARGDAAHRADTATGSARGALRFDGADGPAPIDRRGGYRLDRADVQSGGHRPMPAGAGAVARDHMAFLREQPSSAVAQAANRARRFSVVDARDEANRVSGGQAQRDYLLRRAAADAS